MIFQISHFCSYFSCIYAFFWICEAIFWVRDLIFFVEALNSIYFVNIKFLSPHLHINHPTKRLQNYLICLFLPFLPFCGVVNVEVGEGEILYLQNIYYHEFQRKKKYLTYYNKIWHTLNCLTCCLC